MRRKWIRITVAITLILLPMVILWCTPDLPERVTLAIGQTSGLYEEIIEDLKRELERDLRDRGVEVVVKETKGSSENFRSLLEGGVGGVDIALYQAGTRDFLAEREYDAADTDLDGELSREEVRNAVFTDEYHLDGLDDDGDGSIQREEFLDEVVHAHSNIRFIANTHYDVAHLILRRTIEGREIGSLADLVSLGRRLRISVGLKNSGDYAVSRPLLEAVGIGSLVDERNLSYEEVRRRLLTRDDTTLDGALIMAGDMAGVLHTLLGSGQCTLLPIPDSNALARRNVLIEPHTIFRGFYRSGVDPIPPRDTPTLALRAQLITREDVHPTLVTAVTRVVRRLAFLKKNQLVDLFEQGDDFARGQAEFPIHAGAQSVYDPDIHPLLPTDLVESTEGIRSFVVSFIIAGFFAFRWLKERRQRRTEHRLDRYIRALLDIERRQMPLDRDSPGGDLEPLQELLDEVTRLRQDALGELSAHELNEERGAACFVDMCHELSQKINAKLTRQSMEKQFAQLAAAVGRNGGDADTPGTRKKGI